MSKTIEQLKKLSARLKKKLIFFFLMFFNFIITIKFLVLKFFRNLFSYIPFVIFLKFFTLQETKRKNSRDWSQKPQRDKNGEILGRGRSTLISSFLAHCEASDNSFLNF